MQLLNERMKSMNMAGGLYDIYQKALKMEAEGKSIIHMEIGKPDFDSPVIAKEATIKSLNAGFVHYTAMAGIPELRKAILEKESRENGIVFDPDTEIVVTAGACEAIQALMLTVFNPGEAILVPSPFFSAYSEAAHIAGVEVIEVPLRFENEFELKAEDLEATVTPNTRAVLINTPGNPTGAIIGREELERIADFAKRHDIMVFSDETYDQFLYEGEHVSIYTLPGMKERTVVINSSSKIFSMTGWRVGYAIGPAPLMVYVNKVHQNMSTCATSFVQVGVAEAYLHGGSFTKGMVDEFRIRRDLMVEGLSAIPGVELVVPKGAFYMLPRITKLGVSPRQFCMDLLDKAGVATVPGDAFGKCGDGFFRLSYAVTRESIVEATDRIKKYVEANY